MKRKRSGKPVVDYKSLAKQFKMKSSILRRYGYDLKGISKMLESSGLPEGDVAPLMDGLTQAYEGAVGEPLPNPNTFRTILPYNEVARGDVPEPRPSHGRPSDARLSRRGRATRGRRASCILVPPKPGEADKPMDVHVMKGEYRASAFNLANATYEDEGGPGLPRRPSRRTDSPVRDPRGGSMDRYRHR